MVCLWFSLSGQNPPNIIFIFCDDLNDLERPVMQQAITPNLDLLKTQGVNFSNAHSNAPVCAPSRASIFNGMLPSSSNFYGQNMNQVPWESTPGFDNAITIFEHFKSNGYDVYGTGKIFHKGATDVQLYTEYIDLISTHGPWPWNGLDTLPNGNPIPSGHSLMPVEFSGQLEGIAPLSDVPSFMDYTGWVQGNGPFLYENDSIRDLMTDEKATDVIIDLLNSNHESPFFITSGYYRPHLPYYAPKKYFDLYPIESIQIPENLPDDLEDVPTAMFNNNATGGNLGPEMYKGYVDLSVDSSDTNWWLKRHIQGYLACVSFIDDQIGRVLEALDNSQYAENTIMIVSSDHGLHLGEKFRHHKNSLWAPSTHIPLICKGPGVVSNETCDSPVSLIDIYPTLIDIAEIGNPMQNLDGHSLKPFFSNPTNGIWDGPDFVLSAVGAHEDLNNPSPIVNVNQHFSLLNDTYRFSLMSSGETELYDVSTDSMEYYNLSFDSNYQAIKNDLQLELINAIGLQEDQITQIDSLDALFYGNFEQGINGWSIQSWNGAMVDYSIEENDVFEGQRAFKASVQQVNPNSLRNAVAINSNIVLRQNETYRLSFSAKTIGDIGTLKVQLTKNGDPDFSEYYLESFEVGNSWTEYSFDFIFPGVSTVRNARLFLHFADVTDFIVDEVKIRRLTVPGCIEGNYPEVIDLEQTDMGIAYRLSWQPILGSGFCQVNGGELGGEQVTVTRRGSEQSFINIPKTDLLPGGDYQWRVRCGCKLNPLIIGPWSNYNYFTYADSSEVYNSKVPQGSIKIGVKPNPSIGGFFYLDADFAGIERATLFTSTGQLVRRDMLIGNSVLDCSEFPKGLYIVRFDYQGGSTFEKIIID